MNCSRAVWQSQPGSSAAKVLPFNSPLRAIPNRSSQRTGSIRAAPSCFMKEYRAVYVLSSGRAKVSISSADGRKLIIRIARPGDVLGLYAGLTGRTFEATAEMVEGGRVDFISRSDLLSLMWENHTLHDDLVEMFSRQFSEFVDNTRMLLLSESALEKLARLIVKWGRDFGERTSDGIRVKLLLTQEEIAQIIGASETRPDFQRVKRDQIIRVKRRDVVATAKRSPYRTARP